MCLLALRTSASIVEIVRIPGNVSGFDVLERVEIVAPCILFKLGKITIIYINTRVHIYFNIVFLTGNIRLEEGDFHNIFRYLY